MEQSPSWEANQQNLQLVKKFPAFMELESSTPYPQVPATCPYPEPTPSSPYDPLQLLKIHLNIILPSREIWLEVNYGKTKRMVMSRDQNAGRSHNIKIDN
jgi:hypothetical protein